MGGGADSRIPNVLRDRFCRAGLSVDVICRTYSFIPETASSQIASWYTEIKPDLVIGESLGSNHALLLGHSPLILVSPALKAPAKLGLLASFCLIPGVVPLLRKIIKPREGDRQPLDFHRSSLIPYRKLASRVKSAPAPDSIFAYFGSHDFYRRLGVVSFRGWKRRFGPGTYEIYDGTHFMEEEYIDTLLVQRIISLLDLK